MCECVEDWIVFRESFTNDRDVVLFVDLSRGGLDVCMFDVVMCEFDDVIYVVCDCELFK